MQEKKNRLPAFVRQIGKTVGENRIYIEDYAYGYLCELKSKCDVLPIRAALYGRFFQKEHIRFYFIYGVLCAMEEIQGEKNEEQIAKRFFGDYELIGYVNLYRKGEMPGERQGCYIFYENNEAMQNYLLACRNAQSSKKILQQSEYRPLEQNAENDGYLKETSKKIILGMLVVIAAVAVTTINHYDRIYEFATMAAKAIQEIR